MNSYILLMELFKNDLFAVAVTQTPLSKNFQIIEDWFTALQQELHSVRSQQSIFNKDILEKMQVGRQQIKERKGAASMMEVEQSKLREALGAIGKKVDILLGEDTHSEGGDKQNALEHLMPTSFPNDDNRAENQGTELERKLQLSANDHPHTNQSKQHTKKRGVIDDKLENMRKDIEKTISLLKNRINSFEEDSQEKERQLQIIADDFQEMKKSEEIRLARNIQNRFNSRKKTKKDFSASSKKLDISSSNCKENLQYGTSLKDVKGDDNEKGLPEVSLTVGQGEKMEGKTTEEAVMFLYNEIQKMKQYIVGKNRVIDSNIKEDDLKIQNLERNVDLLERSHQTLKYQYERQQQVGRMQRPLNEKTMKDLGPSRLNETRASNREYYEDKLTQLFQEMENIKNEYLHILEKMQCNEENGENRSVSDVQAEGSRKVKHRLRKSGSDSFEEKDKKQLSTCRRELKKLREEFDELIMGVNNGKNETKTYIIKPNENKEDWKSLSTKMYKTKMEMQSAIKELEGKIVTSNDMTVVLNQLEVGIEENKIVLKKKLDVLDFEKTVKRIEGRLNNFIIQVFEKEGISKEHDAILAKQPWFCLSCDSELKSYTGKLGRYQASGEKPLGKKVNNQSHMVRRNENGRLPSVAK